MRRILTATLEYLLGFLALAVFAYLAFAAGPASDERFVHAFKVASVVALLELVALLAREVPANRLIMGANVWLIVGGAAAFLEQWWLLRIYQHFGEASLFASMLLVGVLAMWRTPAGFVGKVGARRVVLQRSWLLLLAVVLALAVAVVFRGNVKVAAVLPVIALSWLNRLLRHGIAPQA
ncbi:MAG: hypothetical protein ACT6SF_03275 [Hydrogenophaga sp.]|jgi:hypothetical protein|uniref:hypothetical protein n=1 Tax=Hydrogenophaga sp. TaxID=1904254 RepID=UPI001E159633|nr:hypothetical protein [Hydrogenophaga sp.]MBW0168848.1 hypothetical protein [Hydrogenophaga sp.]MBW0183382.1 hypothetical protein [Hydrogenophaga sp.]